MTICRGLAGLLDVDAPLIFFRSERLEPTGSASEQRGLALRESWGGRQRTEVSSKDVSPYLSMGVHVTKLGGSWYQEGSGGLRGLSGILARV